MGTCLVFSISNISIASPEYWLKDSLRRDHSYQGRSTEILQGKIHPDSNTDTLTFAFVRKLVFPRERLHACVVFSYFGAEHFKIGSSIMSYILIFLLALVWKLAIGDGLPIWCVCVCVCVRACVCVCVCVCVCAGGCVENHSTLTTPW